MILYEDLHRSLKAFLAIFACVFFAAGQLWRCCVYLCTFIIHVIQIVFSFKNHFPSHKYDDKVFIVTGMESDIGKAIAEALIERVTGSKVMSIVLVSKDASSITANLKTTISASDAEVDYYYCDVAEENSAKALMEYVMMKYGRLDSLFLVAAENGVWGSISSWPNLSSFKSLISANLYGCLHPVYFALPILEQYNGHIVITSSSRAKIAAPYLSGYSASHHALQGLFESLRLELYGRVFVTIASPGGLGLDLYNKYVNYDGEVLEIPKWLQGSYEEAAKAILRGYENNRWDVSFPFLTSMQIAFRVHFPRLHDRFLLKLVNLSLKASVIAFKQDEKPEQIEEKSNSSKRVKFN